MPLNDDEEDSSPDGHVMLDVQILDKRPSSTRQFSDFNKVDSQSAN